MSFVRTVLGDIDPAELGVTNAHEHLICKAGEHLADTPEGLADMELADVDKSVEELSLFKQSGGNAMLEVSCPEYGRDAAKLAEISRRAGVHVVAATGHIMEGYWRGVLDVGAISDDDLHAEMVRDLTEGFPEAPDVRAGVIKVGTGRDAVHPDEERMLRLASRVQQETGAPITTHTTAGTVPLEQVRIFLDAGANPEHVVIGHQDRRLVWEDHLKVVEAGFRIGYDCISKERYEPDLQRVLFIKRLCEEGYADRIVLGSDIARRSYFTSYGGGPGFTYLLWRFVPWLRQEGVSDEDVQRMLVANPAQTFAFAPVTADVA
jgi:predicted metal-dependent phosphotriesterase family hydrolase